MPVRKTNSGYKYGSKGKTYKTKAKAVKQGQAIHASKKKKRK